jgi:hypothetical protein
METIEAIRQARESRRDRARPAPRAGRQRPRDRQLRDHAVEEILQDGGSIHIRAIRPTTASGSPITSTT